MKAIQNALRWAMIPTILVVCGSLRAQTPRTDVALTFTADRTNPVNEANQWLKGGSFELGVNAWHGFGVAVRVTGITTNDLGSHAVPLNLVLTTFGPRYRWTHQPHAKHSVSVYGEGLIGQANGLNGLFIGLGGTIQSANAFALQTGGGVDYGLGRHVAYRVVEVNWTRTQFQNATTGVQNHTELGAGLVVRF